MISDDDRGKEIVMTMAVVTLCKGSADAMVMMMMDATKGMGVTHV